MPGAGELLAFGSRDGALLWRLGGTAPGQGFGTSIVRSGTTLLVGAPGATDRAGRQTGGVMLVELAGLPYISGMVPGIGDGDGFGTALSTVDDGTGVLAAVLVGAPRAVPGGVVDAGAVYAVSLDGDLLVTFAGPTPGARLGHSSAAILPRQGVTAGVFIGAPAALGGEGLLAFHAWDGTLVWSMPGGEPDARLGAAIAPATDYDLDGIEEVAVGAPGAGGGAGTVYIVRADASLLAFVDGGAGYGLGTSVAAPGDLDGDGFFDLVVGMSGYVWPEGGERPGAWFRYSGIGGQPQLPPDPVEPP